MMLSNYQSPLQKITIFFHNKKEGLKGAVVDYTASF